MYTDLIVKNMTFLFDEKVFFNSISFQALAGEITFIRGKNGSGKSTLMRIISGKTLAEHGTLSVRNQQYSLDNMNDQKKLQAVGVAIPQQFGTMLAPAFTAAQNIVYARFSTYPGLSFAPPLDELHELLAANAVSMNIPVYRLSGGQQQMLALVVATQKERHFLILDEPTAALDDENTERVFLCIKALAQKLMIPVICVSHDADIVKEFASSVIDITVERGQRYVFQQY